MRQRTFISKEEKWAPGFKAGRNRLTLPFHTNSVRFMVQTALFVKLPTPEPWGENKHQLLVFWLFKKAWIIRTFFFLLNWFHRCFVPEVRKYHLYKGLPFKIFFFFLILDNVPGRLEPYEFSTESATHSTLWKGSSVLWMKTLIRRTSWKSGGIASSLKMPLLL